MGFISVHLLCTRNLITTSQFQITLEEYIFSADIALSVNYSKEQALLFKILKYK